MPRERTHALQPVCETVAETRWIVNRDGGLNTEQLLRRFPSYILDGSQL